MRRARASGPLWTAALVAERVLRVNTLGRFPDRRIPLDVLRAEVERLLARWGVAEPEVVAGHVLYADVHGIESHGVAMLRHYATGYDLRAVPTVVGDSVIDAGGGIGHLAADRAMRLAMDKARADGAGVVAVRNTGHFGAAGAYAALARDDGLIGLALTNTRDPAVVPTFGADPKLGTNAIAFAARDLMLDMATSTASLGRAFAAWRRGRRIPAGWAIDGRGRPVRNGRRAAEARRLTPLGGTAAGASYKGYGLAAMVELLCGRLAGEGVGHFMLALDPARFAPGFADRADALFADLRGTRPLDPARPVLLPGDPERAARADRELRGIPLSRSVVEDLRLLGLTLPA